MAELGWYDKALECMEKEDYAQAKEYFEKAVEEGVTKAYCDLGNLGMAKGQVSDIEIKKMEN